MFKNLLFGLVLTVSLVNPIKAQTLPSSMFSLEKTGLPNYAGSNESNDRYWYYPDTFNYSSEHNMYGILVATKASDNRSGGEFFYITSCESNDYYAYELKEEKASGPFRIMKESPAKVVYDFICHSARN